MAHLLRAHDGQQRNSIVFPQHLRPGMCSNWRKGTRSSVMDVDIDMTMIDMPSLCQQISHTHSSFGADREAENSLVSIDVKCDDGLTVQSEAV
jgi:hypothetical protein